MVRDANRYRQCLANDYWAGSSSLVASEGKSKLKRYEDPNIVSQLIEVVDIVWRSKRILREIRV
jgi:hypothetical protein